jgi:hypothetical protein
VGKEDSFCGDLRPLEKAMVGNCEFGTQVSVGSRRNEDSSVGLGRRCRSDGSGAVSSSGHATHQCTRANHASEGDSRLKDINRAAGRVEVVEDRTGARKGSRVLACGLQGTSIGSPKLAGAQKRSGAPRPHGRVAEGSGARRVE